MLKILIICSLFMSSFVASASSIHQPMSMKERLRLSLWIEGLENDKKVQTQRIQQHIEEIERPLRKL